MRKNTLIWVLPLLLFGAYVLVTSGCKKDDDDDDGGYECITETLMGEDVQVCCNLTDCYYEWNGTRYNCDGTDCEEAAAELVEDMFGTIAKSSDYDKDEILQKLNEMRYNTGDCGCE